MRSSCMQKNNTNLLKHIPFQKSYATSESIAYDNKIFKSPIKNKILPLSPGQQIHRRQEVWFSTPPFHVFASFQPEEKVATQLRNYAIKKTNSIKIN